MIDHLLGTPSNAHRRWAVLAVLAFWSLRLRYGSRTGPKALQALNRRLARFTPWQTIVATCTAIYMMRNLQHLLGLQAPEPLARMYSKPFYRATWLVTALDAGHATGMHVRPAWLRHFLSLVFSGYYVVFAQEADEKLRKYRAAPTVEFLRVTWNKTSNPIVRFATRSARPKVKTFRPLELPRPADSQYARPVRAVLYYSGTEQELRQCNELILDVPGGGFVCMAPEHHEERILRWTIRTKRPVLSLDYQKSPEGPFPYALHETYDVYRLLHDGDNAAKLLGMRPNSALRVVLSGDSAGANLCCAMMYKTLEMPAHGRPPPPIQLILAYPALDFNLSAWMQPSHLAVLHRNESTAGALSLATQKDHWAHRGPLSVVPDDDLPPTTSPRSRGKSWRRSFARLSRMSTTPDEEEGSSDPKTRDSYFSAAANRPLRDRVLAWDSVGAVDRPRVLSAPTPGSTPGGAQKDDVVGATARYTTRLTMTSRSAYFSDRILTAPMMRAMALLYVGPRTLPDLSSNYYISPILAPEHLLAQFPPVHLICGEKDPLSDDTIIFGGRLREAKLRRQAEARAAGSKHGEGLRMSAPSAKPDPILDESDADWVQTRIVEGWSHGFLQMITLLPEVESYINAMADWITAAFEKAAAAEPQPVKRAMTVAAAGTSKRPSTPAKRVPAPVRTERRSLNSDGESTEPEDAVLSFTPRRRNGNGNGAGTPSSRGPKQTVASPGPAGKQDQSPPFLRSGRRSSSLDETMLPLRTKSAPLALQAETMDRRGSESNVVAPAFMDDRDLLRRRREEAVFGLGTEGQ